LAHITRTSRNMLMPPLLAIDDVEAAIVHAEGDDHR
jgi:hypothetical protein